MASSAAVKKILRRSSGTLKIVSSLSTGVRLPWAKARACGQPGILSIRSSSVMSPGPDQPARPRYGRQADTAINQPPSPLTFGEFPGGDRLQDTERRDQQEDDREDHPADGWHRASPDWSRPPQSSP